MFYSLTDKAIAIHRVRSALKPWSSPAFCYPQEIRKNIDPESLRHSKDGKVFVTGMPKSGNNWLLGLVSHCLDVDVIEEAHRKAKGVFMSHLSFSSHLYLRSDIFYGVYIIRDLRDVVCSFFHYVNKKPGIAGVIGLDDIVFDDIESFYFQCFLSRLVTRYNIPGHVDGYLDRGIPMVKYERLLDDPERELKFLFRYWNIRVSDELICEAIALHDFENMKSKGKDDRGHKLDPSHMRKGKQGGFIDELPPNVLKDIERRYGDYLQRWGYSLTTT